MRIPTPNQPKEQQDNAGNFDLISQETKDIERHVECGLFVLLVFASLIDDNLCLLVHCPREIL